MKGGREVKDIGRGSFYFLEKKICGDTIGNIITKGAGTYKRGNNQ